MFTKNTLKKEIFIPTVGEGTRILRPAMGEEVGDYIYKVLPTEKYNPDKEEWEFPPGSIVKCEKRLVEGKELLIAVSFLN